MTKDKEKTDVIFRECKENGEIIAVFPYVIDSGYLVVSYSHIGQHSSCDYDWFISNCKPVMSDKYVHLLMELEELGYNLNILLKRNYGKYLQKLKEAR